MDHFFYAIADERHGPVTRDALIELVRAQAVTAKTLVWSEGMAGWLPLVGVFPQWFVEAAPVVPAAAVPPPEVPAVAPPEPARLTVANTACCAVSKRRLPKSEMLQFGSDFVAPEFRQAYLERVEQGLPPSADGFTAASVGQRIAATILDGLVMLGLLFVCGVLAALILPAFRLAGTETSFDGRTTGSLIPLALFVGMSAVYQIVMVAVRGATLGKMAVKIEVIDAQGRRPGWGAAAGRWALKSLLLYVPAIGVLAYLTSIIMALVDQPWRRALHDRGAGTRVVRCRR